MLKHLFLFLGSMIIGFGLGLIAGSYFALSLSSLWLFIIISLIGGGFLLALSLRRTAKPKPVEKSKEKIDEKIKDNEEQPITENKYQTENKD